jgi:hypothetical protein
MEDFARAMNKCRSLVQQNEQDTNLLYDWFVRGKECEVRETYRDSQAFLKHLDNVGGALGELLKHSTLSSLRVYGEPSEKLKEAVSGLNAEIYSPL